MLDHKPHCLTKREAFEHDKEYARKQDVILNFLRGSDLSHLVQKDKHTCAKMNIDKQDIYKTMVVISVTCDLPNDIIYHNVWNPEHYVPVCITYHERDEYHFLPIEKDGIEYKLHVDKGAKNTKEVKEFELELKAKRMLVDDVVLHVKINDGCPCGYRGPGACYHEIIGRQLK
jgi:hypothetical protein